MEVCSEKPSIPGDFHEKEQVFYTGQPWSFLGGDVLVYGAVGEVMGRSCVGQIPRSMNRDEQRSTEQQLSKGKRWQSSMGIRFAPTQVMETMNAWLPSSKAICILRSCTPAKSPGRRAKPSHRPVVSCRFMWFLSFYFFALSPSMFLPTCTVSKRTPKVCLFS